MRTPALLLAVALTSCASAPRVPPQAEELRKAIDAADVVFYGETHDDRRQHAYEVELLRRLDEAPRRPVLLGMEMFQHPFQGALDDYVAGRIDEKEMLRRTEYFTRWNFDSTLYAPLWRYCREHGVRIVALNCDGAITRKVGREGLDKLTPEERAQIAADVDIHVEAHRKRLSPVFEGSAGAAAAAGPHGAMTPERREFMYQAMTVWDETMADSAAFALEQAGPRARMLVVAGRGHIEELTGIPDRLQKRRREVQRAVIVGGTDEKAKSVSTARDGNQWLVTFPEFEEPPAPKLGVSFETAKPRDDGLLVLAVTAGGAAANAGVVAGDVVTRLAGAPVRDLTDFRYVLDTKKTGDVVEIEITRDGVAGKVLSVTLTPPPPPTAAPAPQPAPKP